MGKTVNAAKRCHCRPSPANQRLLFHWFNVCYRWHFIVCVSIVMAPAVDMRWRSSYCRAERVGCGES